MNTQYNQNIRNFILNGPCPCAGAEALAQASVARY
jgi:hypothetical protein